MAPGQQIEQLAALNQRIAELEAQIERLRRAEQQQFRQMADAADEVHNKSPSAASQIS